MIALQGKNITKKFASLVALNNVDIEVEQGELFGLLGPNGSGKTTLIKILTGQIKPTSGSATVLGIDCLKDPIKVREAVSIIPEQENPPTFLTSEEYLYFVGKIRKLENLKEKVDNWLRLLEFENQRGVLCKDLSRGTRQKLMFAQAFLNEPKIAFIDEPLINLDPIIQRKVKDFLTDYVKKGGTIFFSTHVLEIAEEICTSIGIIYEGRMIFSGKMKEVRKSHSRLEKFFLEKIQKNETA